ncbi:hypothetical protein [Lactobacillus crispatus]|nr:hypothetical protein [Lactobacillus crispatus]
MAKRHQYLWCLVELPNGKCEWYCISKVLRKALLWEKIICIIDTGAIL